MKNRTAKYQAFLFIILLGLTSLFTDMTYQGARSISGPYLAQLGASAATISIIYGLGELIGHGLRIATGYLADRYHLYWVFIVFGYLLNAITLPFLAFTYSWELAAALILTERIGKAIRSPARDTLVSYMGPRVGMGWGFGIHKALDQTGGMLGPLGLMFVMFMGADYRQAFAYLIIPAIFSMITLAVIYNLFPEVKKGQSETMDLKVAIKTKSKPFWIYLVGTSCIAAGLVDFPLIAFHLEKTSLIQGGGLPAIYTIAMGFSAISALILGRLFDRFGISILIFTAALSALFPLFIFLGSLPMVIIGTFIWAIGMGSTESLMKSMVANITSARWRGSYYGIFNTIYGVAWFLGSLIIGLLYDVSIPYLVTFSAGMQLLAIPLFIWLKRTIN